VAWIRWGAGFTVGALASWGTVAWATSSCPPPWLGEHRFMVPEAEGGELDIPCEFWAEGEGTSFDARVICRGRPVWMWEGRDAR